MQDMRDASSIMRSVAPSFVDRNKWFWNSISAEYQNMADEYLSEVNVGLSFGLNQSNLSITLSYIYQMYGITKKCELSSCYAVFASFSRSLSILTAQHEFFPSLSFSLRQSLCDKINNRVVYVFDNDCWLGHIQIFTSYVKTLQPFKVFVLIRYKSDILNRFINRLIDYGIDYLFIGNTNEEANPFKLLQLIHFVDSQALPKAFIWVGFPPLQVIGGLQPYTTPNFAWQFKYYHPLSVNHNYTLFGYAMPSQIGLKIFHPSSYCPIVFSPHLLDIDLLDDLENQVTELDKQILDEIKLKKSQGGKIMISICRPEKIYSSQSTINNIKSILSFDKTIHFYCTIRGKNEKEMILNCLKECSSSVIDRVNFIPWTKNVDLIIKSSDIFLDTYPFGCGITLLQALKHSLFILMPVKSVENFIMQQSNSLNSARDLCINDPHLRHIAYEIFSQIEFNPMIQFFNSGMIQSSTFDTINQYFLLSEEKKKNIAEKRASILKSLLGGYNQMSQVVEALIND